MIAIGDSSENFRLHPSSVADVHRAGTNILYCDGHVQWRLRADLTHLDPTTLHGQRTARTWNYDHRP
jgi:prepilin-type processing-associated H-X9-DG protein